MANSIEIEPNGSVWLDIDYAPLEMESAVEALQNAWLEALAHGATEIRVVMLRYTKPVGKEAE